MHLVIYNQLNHCLIIQLILFFVITIQNILIIKSNSNLIHFIYEINKSEAETSTSLFLNILQSICNIKRINFAQKNIAISSSKMKIYHLIR